MFESTLKQFMLKPSSVLFYSENASEETSQQACRATTLLGIALIVHQEAGTTRIITRFIHLKTNLSPSARNSIGSFEKPYQLGHSMDNHCAPKIKSQPSKGNTITSEINLVCCKCQVKAQQIYGTCNFVPPPFVTVIGVTGFNLHPNFLTK